MLDFETTVEVSLTKNGKTVYGKTKVKWKFTVTAASWGISWLGLSVPDQVLSLELKEDVYDEKTDRDEEKEWTEEYSLTDVEVEGSVFSIRQDICPTELVIPEKGKAYITFPESDRE